jgi:GR25 family glycosyltransferase involved in LPS biosynthesis
MTDVFVINLDRSTERWAAFEKANATAVRFSRFRAIEGAAQSRPDLQASGILNLDVPYTDGAVGCAMSHIALWKMAATENRNLTICEDDAVFNGEFTLRSEALLQQLDGKFDVILWGWNFDSVLSYQLLPGVSICAARFDQGRMRASMDRFRKLRFQPSLYRLARAFGLPCYTVSPQGAQTLLERSLPLRNMAVRFPGYDHMFPNNGIDIVMSALYPDLRAYVSLPPLVITPNERAVSTVQTDGADLHETIIISE